MSRMLDGSGTVVAPPPKLTPEAEPAAMALLVELLGAARFGAAHVHRRVAAGNRRAARHRQWVAAGIGGVRSS